MFDGEIIVKFGKSKGRRFPICEGERFTIGRSLKADIQLLDEGLSRIHCSIENLGVQFVIRDADSSNGTFLNGKSIKEEAAYDGDEVTIGLAVLSLAGPRRAEGDDRKITELNIPIIDGQTEVRKVDPREAEMLKADGDATLGRLRRAHRDLVTIYRVSNAINAITAPHDLADTLVETLLEVTTADHAAVLLGGTDGLIEPLASRNRGGEPTQALKISRTVVTEVMRKGVSVISRNVPEDARYSAGDSLVMQRVQSMMCVPLLAQGDVIGALYVDSRASQGAFDDQDLELFAAIGNQAGVALQRVKLLSDLENLFFSSIRSLVAAIDRKDQYTHGHSERVTTFALKLAKEVGVSDHEREVLQLAGILHDIGKIGVPEYVLNKPGELSDEEYEKMKLHSIHGAEIISTIQSPNVPDIAAAVRHHHERWDGTGYPDGLGGSDVPRVARILALADAFDAMTSDRPYRKGFSMDRAVTIVRECAGAQFDPELAEIFAGLHERGELFLPRSMAHKYTTMAMPTLE